MSTTASAIRWFTPEMANKSLPLVGAILSDIRELDESVREREFQIEQMMGEHGDSWDSPYQDELSAMRRSLDSDRRRIREYESELVALGVCIVEDDRTTIEFPAWVDNRAVRLSWTLGGIAVDRWREIGDPTSTRRDIDDVCFGEGPDIALLGDL